MGGLSSCFLKQILKSCPNRYHTCKNNTTVSFPFCVMVMRLSWDENGGENRVFQHLSFAIASEKVTKKTSVTPGIDWNFQTEVKNSEILPFVASVSRWMCKCIFFRGSVGVFWRRGNTFISLPMHSHSVLHTHTHERTPTLSHTYTHRDTKG